MAPGEETLDKRGKFNKTILDMELKPHIGIDNIKFGMTQDEVIEIMGKPDRIIVDQEENDQFLLEFFKLRLDLGFHVADEGKLGYIKTSNPDLMFEGQKIVGTKIESARRAIFDDGIGYTYDSNGFWLILDEEYGTVTHIKLGVAFEEECNREVQRNDDLLQLFYPALGVLRCIFRL